MEGGVGKGRGLREALSKRQGQVEAAEETPGSGAIRGPRVRRVVRPGTSFHHGLFGSVFSACVFDYLRPFVFFFLDKVVEFLSQKWPQGSSSYSPSPSFPD